MSARRYCGHVCSHTSDADCDCDCRCMAACPHSPTCASQEACGERHPDCNCPEPHEFVSECRPWLLENPADDKGELT